MSEVYVHPRNARSAIRVYHTTPDCKRLVTGHRAIERERIRPEDDPERLIGE